MGRSRRFSTEIMKNDESIEALASNLRGLDATRRTEAVRLLSVPVLVQLLGTKWRSVGDYAWGALRGNKEKEKVYHMVIDALRRKQFRYVDSRVRALGLLVAEAVRSEDAKAIYREYLSDRSPGVIGTAIPGCVWSLDDEAIPLLMAVLQVTKDEYLKDKIPKAIKAIESRDPRLLEGGAYDPAKWGLTLESKK